MNNVTIIRPESREEWLEIRKSGIGSSEVATIVGLNPWETPYQLWRRKKGLDEPKQENAAMRNGHHLEDAVSKMWNDATGREIIKRSAIDWIIRDNDRPYLQVSPDRTYWLGESRSPEDKGILEIKTTRMKVDPEDLPKYWFAQVQYQLGVAGYTQGSLAWLSAGQGFDFGYQDLKLVPDFFGWLIEEVDKFWTDNILGGKEPNAVSVADVLLKYNRHTDRKIIECSDEVFEAYQNLKAVKKEIKALEERQEVFEETIKMAFGDAEALSYGGDTIATWKAPKESLKFDAKTFQAEHPDLVKPYLQVTQGARRFLLK
ncbi:MAG: endonuclease [Barnesiella sp.]|nr:endonuclease [Barnesiella sp.]